MKNNKTRLFEVMGRVNKDFINEVEQVPLNPNYQLQTYGDLKKIINVIKLKQKGAKVANIGLDILLSSVPFLSNAKSAFDVYKAAFSKPDTSKTNTWLDKLDIDDKFSSIIDDTVENGFLKMMSDTFNREPDNKPLEPDFNMNEKLIEYLKTNYNGRTVTYK